jgi:hypothetical protein
MDTVDTLPLKCAHWEKIDSPDGPVAKGVCRFCGRVKWYETTYGYQYGYERLEPKG